MIKLGITGHRPNRLIVSEARLAARVRSVLQGLIKISREPARLDGPVLDIISPLAEGCDRIVAREALTLGQRLTAILPFEQHDYEATFGDPRTTKEFRALWRASEERVVLKGLPGHAEASYVAAGNVTLARCDIVLTIWDGKPAQGRGGTPEILQNALEWGVAVIWIHATEDRKPVLLTGQRRGKAIPRLDYAAKRGQALTASRLRGLLR